MARSLRFIDKYEERWVSVTDLVAFLDAQADELQREHDDQMAVLCVWLARSFNEYASVAPNSTVAVEATLRTEAEMRADLQQMVKELDDARTFENET